MSKTGGTRGRVVDEMKEARVQSPDPDLIFSGNTTLAEMPHVLGLSSFETQAMVAKLVDQGSVRALYRGELETRFKAALDEDLPYSVKLYECALESPEFANRGRILDRVFFGSKTLQAASEKAEVSFSARIRGRRALQVLLGLFRRDRRERVVPGRVDRGPTRRCRPSVRQCQRATSRGRGVSTVAARRVVDSIESKAADWQRGGPGWPVRGRVRVGRDARRPD